MTLRMFWLTLQVFNNLHNQNQELLVQNWVMLSLSNFTQRTPVSMATWSLTCFFISASTNSWLRPLYPFVRLYRHHTVALLDIMNIKSIHKLLHSEYCSQSLPMLYVFCCPSGAEPGIMGGGGGSTSWTSGSLGHLNARSGPGQALVGLKVLDFIFRAWNMSPTCM